MAKNKLTAADFLIEIATTDFNTTQAAVNGGADRIELCSSIGEGGITPSVGLMKRCREKFSLPIFPIIRPRPGDFLYSDDEFAIMLQDIRTCRQVGFDGVVVGLLKRDGTIDKKRTEKIVSTAFPMQVTFHRAFDRCKDPFLALEELEEAGCSRVLTSGQQPTAIEGVELIGKLIQQAVSIIVMPGSGVRAENISQIRKKTGAKEFHASLKGQVKTKMNFLHPAFADSPESYMIPDIGRDAVKKLRKAITA